VTHLGWPTLRPGFPLTSFLNAMRDIRAAVAGRSSANAMPVIAVVGAGASEQRSIAALNFALAAARDDVRVLMIDADHETHKLSNRVNRPSNSEPGRLGWLSIGSKASRAIKTANGISILPSVKSKAGEAIGKAIAQARSAGGYDLVILDGPAIPWSAADRKLLEAADGIVAILPVSLDINDSMEDIIAALGETQRKLAGVILNEFRAPVTPQRGKQYA
jgi:cellulose biosynthesis protein BcsQ